MSQPVAVVGVGPLGAGVEWLQVQIVALSLVLEVHCAVALCGGSIVGVECSIPIPSKQDGVPHVGCGEDEVLYVLVYSGLCLCVVSWHVDAQDVGAPGSCVRPRPRTLWGRV